MRWIHCTINGKLGTSETITHTLNFRTAPDPDVDQDVQDIQTFANQLRDAWATWWSDPAAANGAAVKVLFGTHLTYTDVTAAYLEQTAPATITTHTSRKTGHPVKDFTYPRPTYLVDTQYAEFAPGVSGTSADAPLPYEVACCVTLSSGLRGPRNRGRLYLGGLTVNAIGADGTFRSGYPQGVAAAAGSLIHTLNSTMGGRVHVVSRAYNTSVGVNGVQVGVVPDSQRRRRVSQDEKYGAVIAT